ncbi:MAG TPA: helix-turn-helix transcriptional regulator [Gemmatimonadales bacterium]|nr:helix-turn-helix transcriptional regulator [Gemmatimonadales bacterium]
MDVSFVIRQRLEEFGLEQRELARAAQVTESYISQLLTRKKAPPAPGRTDIYEKIERFLKLPNGELARLVRLQRKAELKRELGEEPAPLFREVRELILRKCHPDRERQVRAIFEAQPFGELERLVTQRLLDVVTAVAKEELGNEYWLRMVADLSDRSFEEMRVIVLEFLDTDIFHLTREQCVAFLEPLIESWDIDLATFALDIVLNPRVVAANVKRFEFVEREPGQLVGEEPGLSEFLRDPTLSGGVTEDEVAFLRRLAFGAKRPTPLYYYRELQSLRDPLHFSRAVD